MANPSTVLAVRLALQVTATEAAAAIDGLTGEENTMLEGLLVRYEAVSERAADLTADGVNYSADKHRRLILNKMAQLLGLAPSGGVNFGAVSPDSVSPTVAEAFGD